MTSDIPIATQREIINQELALYRNTRYQAQLRYRVHKAISATPEQLEAMATELAKIEQVLDLLNAELDATGAA